MRRVSLARWQVLILGLLSCVPADDALPLGSAQFTVTGRGAPNTVSQTVDGWELRFERYLLSFQSMTIVNLMDSAQCSYRGSGLKVNTVFDGISGSLVQAFNGIKPGACPDVGMRLAPPDNRFVVGEGASPTDLSDLALNRPAHALLEAMAVQRNVGSREKRRNLKIRLRFDSERTTTSFAACQDAIRGTRISPNARYSVFVAFRADAFFRDAISPSAGLRLDPFSFADKQGNDDGVVTMDELDALPLGSFTLRSIGQFYRLPDGTRNGSFGDYVRAQFQFAATYGSGGLCVGVPAELDDGL